MVDIKVGDRVKFIDGGRSGAVVGVHHTPYHRDMVREVAWDNGGRGIYMSVSLIPESPAPRPCDADARRDDNLRGVFG